MKKSIFVLFTALLAVFTANAVSYQRVTDINNLTAGDWVVITMEYDGIVYALNGDDATSSNPKSDAIEVDENVISDPDAKYVFVANPVESGWTFTREDGLMLYINSSGIRVGSATNALKAGYIWNVEYGYLYAVVSSTNKYIGVYHRDGNEKNLKEFADYPYSTSGSSGWKKYINGETLAFFVNSPSGDPTQPKFDVTADEVEGGKIVVSVPKAGEGALVEVAVVADKGYDFVEGSLMLLYSGSSTKIVDGQFVMPAEAVTVTGEFEGRSPRATIDFTDVDNLWQLPENRTIETQAFTLDGLTISLTGTGDPEKQGGYVWSKRAGGHLLLGRKDAMLQLPLLADCEVAKIVTNGKDDASGLVETNIFVGDKAVSTTAVGSKKQNTFLIGREDRGLGTQYNLVILNDNAAQIAYIDIYATIPGAPEAPEMSVKAGIYKEAQTIALICSTEGASIYYTTDSSRPTERTELLYSTPVVIDKNQTKTIRAIAVKDGIKSEISSATYVIADVASDGTLDNPYSVEDVHKLSNPGWKAWVHGFIINGFDSNIKVRELSDQATNAIAIADTPDETDKSKMSFVELPQGKERDELNVVAHPENIGKEVWVYGVLSNYGNQPGVSKTSKHYLDQLPEPEVPASVEDNANTSALEIMKVVRDGQLLILRNGVWYNVTGVRVE